MKKLILILLVLLSNNIFAQLITIDSVRKQDANGVPLLLNQIVTVRGVVTTQREFGNPLVYFQVPTAGLVCYDTLIGNHANRGDSVQVTGKVVHYSGLTELQPVNSYTLLATGITTPAPVVITVGEARVNGENYEGRLIKINGITQVKNTSGVPVTQWTVTSSGTNYRIFVGNDSCEIRIYATTNIANTIIPPYPFDVTALMSQYKTSSPYFGGYQILPRDLNDIVSQAVGPIISSVPLESNILSSAVTISFSTQSAGDTKIKYFVSDSLFQPVVYTDSAYDATQTTTHQIILNNLKPGRIYYATVSSTNALGTSIYTPKYFSTASHPASTGKMEVYFNFAVDTTVALPNNKANGNTDYKTRLNQRIDSALYSIDMALYSFIDISLIRDHLLSAFSRGVKIRMVYDYRSGTPQPLVQDLINAGIKVSIRPSDSYIMHNKFFIFDARDTSLHSKKWLWTGSANIGNDQFYNDAENVIFIQDESLCNVYTREFEEMFGSHNNNNNPALAKFGPQKTDNTPHIFNINGKRLESYFSPSDDVSGKIQSLIDLQTDKSINFCIFDFTLYVIENKMKAEFNPPAKMVRGVFDHGQVISDSANGYLIYHEMKGIGGQYPWNPAAKVFRDKYAGLLHDKYIIIDADLPSSNPVVETGSFNFTNSAQIGNDENVLFIFDSLVANQYYQDFAQRLPDAGGLLGLEQLSQNTPDKYELYQNYPNPFNPATKIKFAVTKNSKITINIFNILGQKIETLIDKNLFTGLYQIEWHPGNLSSGVYYYVMKTGDFIDTKKMLYIK
jgi:phosphatidylserine/phosphatidylglycerophosphate/cardiolipin synthase-like enzyme